VRNRIYHEVFDLDWIQANMPEPELRRQRSAGRKGMLRGFGVAVILLLAYLLLGPVISRQRQAWQKRRAVATMRAAYDGLRSYADAYEALVDVQIGGVRIPLRGAGTLLLVKPDRRFQSLSSSSRGFGSEIQIVSDGRQVWSYLPAKKEYTVRPWTRVREPDPETPALLSRLGPTAVQALYHLFLTGRGAERLPHDARNVRFAGRERLDGEETTILQWDHDAAALLRAVGLTNVPAATLTNLPVAVWVGSDGLVRQIRLDLSPWAGDLLAVDPDVAVSRLVLTETHHNIRPNLPVADDAFVFHPPLDARQVERFDQAPLGSLISAAYREGRAKRVPARYPLTLPGMADLSDFYNSSLDERWHPGEAGNNLSCLPSGILVFSGVPFDVRGLIQLSSRTLQAVVGDFPQGVVGMKIGQRCRLLHFLQASAWAEREGKPIGRYVLHYADGQVQVLPIIYGADLRDWHVESDSSERLARATTVWRGRNAAGYNVRLFRSTRENPRPEVEVESVDFVSDMAGAAPFLIALTVEP
jgi:hypothetical protein